MNQALQRKARILLVDDDPGLLRLMSIRLKSEGFDVAACESAQQALTALPRFRPDVVITDLRMAEQDGLGLLKELQRRYPALPVIMMTAHGTIPDAVDATQSGAFAFLTKPVDKDELLEKIRKALRVSVYAQPGDTWRAGIVTRSPLMEERLHEALAAAGTGAPILITGPNGTGKSLLARSIALATDGNLDDVENISAEAVTPEILRQRLEGSKGGTMILDEIGGLSASCQAVLMESTSAWPRFISTTARSIPLMISTGQFREELYFRLGVHRIDLPPLSQRREDIPLLATHLLSTLPTMADTRRLLAPEAMELLITADWPGNVSQLESHLAQAAALCPTPVISAEGVQRAIGGSAAARLPSFDEARDEFTRNYLLQLLQITRGNVTQAARLAGRNRTDFYKLLARHKISTESFKD